MFAEILSILTGARLWSVQELSSWATQEIPFLITKTNHSDRVLPRMDLSWRSENWSNPFYRLKIMLRRTVTTTRDNYLRYRMYQSRWRSQVLIIKRSCSVPD